MGKKDQASETAAPESAGAELPAAELEASAPPAPPPPPAPPEDGIEVRVLTDCALGKGNSVAVVSASEYERFAALGEVDRDPDAVAYAKSLAQP